jgi:DNA-binding transcriptional LysR family regulator
VLTVPRLTAERFAPPRSTARFVRPVAAPVALTRMSLIWHDRPARHPAHWWLREALLAVGASLSR